MQPNTATFFANRVLTAGIVLVWFINGLFCKLLNLVPRHRMIVGRILGARYADSITNTIGILEIAMTVWILSRIRPRLCALTQIMIIAVMNSIEFFCAPDLLLFGRANAVVAVFFITVILINEFVLDTSRAKQK